MTASEIEQAVYDLEEVRASLFFFEKKNQKTFPLINHLTRCCTPLLYGAYSANSWSCV